MIEINVVRCVHSIENEKTGLNPMWLPETIFKECIVDQAHLLGLTKDVETSLVSPM